VSAAQQTGKQEGRGERETEACAEGRVHEVEHRERKAEYGQTRRGGDLPKRQEHEGLMQLNEERQLVHQPKLGVQQAPPTVGLQLATTVGLQQQAQHEQAGGSDTSKAVEVHLMEHDELGDEPRES
jgi:hypothetical protein